MGENPGPGTYLARSVQKGGLEECLEKPNIGAGRLLAPGGPQITTTSLLPRTHEGRRHETC